MKSKYFSIYTSFTVISASILTSSLLISCNHSSPSDSTSNSGTVQIQSIPDSLAVEFHITRKLAPKEREDFLKFLTKKNVNYAQIATQIFRAPLETDDEHKDSRKEFLSSAKEDLMQHIDSINENCLPEYHHLKQDPEATKPQQKQNLEEELTLTGKTCPIDYVYNKKMTKTVLSQTDEKTRMSYVHQFKLNSQLKDAFLKTQSLKSQDIKEYDFNVSMNTLIELNKDKNARTYIRATGSSNSQRLNGQNLTAKVDVQFLTSNLPSNKKAEIVGSFIIEFQGHENEVVNVVKSSPDDSVTSENHLYINKEEILDPAIKEEFTKNNFRLF